MFLLSLIARLIHGPDWERHARRGRRLSTPPLTTKAPASAGLFFWPIKNF